MKQQTAAIFESITSNNYNIKQQLDAAKHILSPHQSPLLQQQQQQRNPQRNNNELILELVDDNEDEATALELQQEQQLSKAPPLLKPLEQVSAVAQPSKQLPLQKQQQLAAHNAALTAASSNTAAVQHASRKLSASNIPTIMRHSNSAEAVNDQNNNNSKSFRLPPKSTSPSIINGGNNNSPLHQRSRSVDYLADAAQLQQQQYIKQRLSNGQIEFCGFLSRPFVSMQKNNNILATTMWKRLWFELRRDNKLLYYETREAQKPLASIPLDNFYIRISKELYPQHFCFELVSYNFIYQFVAASHADMERWMDVLKRKSQAEAENNLLCKAEEQIIEAEKQRSSFVQTYGENTHLRLRYYQQLLKPGAAPSSPPQQHVNRSPQQGIGRNSQQLAKNNVQ